MLKTRYNCFCKELLDINLRYCTIEQTSLAKFWQDLNLARKQAYIKAEKRSIIVSLYFGQPSGPCLDQMCYLQARTEDICAEACGPHPRGLYSLPE